METLLRATSPRAQGDLLAGSVRRAVKEAAGAAVDKGFSDMNLSAKDKQALLARVDRLPDLAQRVVFPTSVDDVDQAKADLHDLFNHLEQRLIPYPKLLDDLRRDLLPTDRTQASKTLPPKLARLAGSPAQEPL